MEFAGGGFVRCTRSRTALAQVSRNKMDTNTEPEVIVERIGDVDLLTINRPEMRNALRFETYEMLEAAVRNTTARCMVDWSARPARRAGDRRRAVVHRRRD